MSWSIPDPLDKVSFPEPDQRDNVTREFEDGLMSNFSGVTIIFLLLRSNISSFWGVITTRSL